MKYISTIFLSIFSLTLCAQWTLHWSDEFSGSSLDKTKWNVEKGGGSAWNNTAVDDPSVIQVSNGSLKLKGIKNPNYNGSLSSVSSIDKNTVWTGAIDSHHKFGFKYGKMEVRARIEAAPRAWPAIWLMPVESKYGGNPYSGEIDIVEHLNYDNFYYSTVHTEYHLTNKNDPERYGEGFFSNDDNEWVVYGMEWDDQKIDFLRNGVVYHTVNKGAGLYVNGLLRWPFDEDFYIILSQQIGGGWVDGEAASKGLVLKDSDLPLTMEIDYVRVYKKSTQTINYDISVDNIVRTDNSVCGTIFDINFEITNNGAQQITSFDYEVYVDNQLVNSDSKSVSLSNTASTTVSLNGINGISSGSKTVKVVVSKPNGNNDEEPGNNEAISTLTLSEGELHEFFITENAASKNLSWTIKDGSTTIVSSNGISSNSSNGEIVQPFCLPSGCYSIEVTDAFGGGSNGCSAVDWISGTQYCEGEQVVKNGTLYEAKWCGTDDPASSGQWGQWKEIGACTPAVSGFYGIRKSNSSSYFEVKSDNYSSPYSTSFCTEGEGINVDFTVSIDSASNCDEIIVTAKESPKGTSYEWKFGEGAVPATASTEGPHTIQYSTGGNKTISLTVDGHEQSKKDIIKITQVVCGVGSSEVFDQYFQFYPNPTKNFAIVEGENLELVEIFNGQGKLIQKHVVSGNLVKLNTQGLAPGLFFIRITANNQSGLKAFHKK